MPRTNEALAFSTLELLQAYVSERLDRFVDHLINTGARRVAVLGSREHATWLAEEIYGFRHIPITAFIERPDRPGDFADMDVLSVTLTDDIVPTHADAVLIADDQCEQTLHKLAVQQLPLGTTIYRIYHRFPIGTKQLSTVQTVQELKPTTAKLAHPVVQEIKPCVAETMNPAQ